VNDKILKALKQLKNYGGNSHNLQAVATANVRHYIKQSSQSRMLLPATYVMLCSI